MLRASTAWRVTRRSSRRGTCRVLSRSRKPLLTKALRILNKNERNNPIMRKKNSMDKKSDLELSPIILKIVITTRRTKARHWRTLVM
jgi:hypothetical protein